MRKEVGRRALVVLASVGSLMPCLGVMVLIMKLCRYDDNAPPGCLAANKYKKIK